MTGSLVVDDEGTLLSFSFAELLRYSGPRSPAGVALAHQVMAGSFPLLDTNGPLRRRAITIDTAFRGPGARDAFEMVTRASTEGRYVVNPGRERPERGPTLEAFIFRLGYRDRFATSVLREGWVTDEFVSLARSQDRSPAAERHFTDLKRDTAQRLMAATPAEIFDVAIEDLGSPESPGRV